MKKALVIGINEYPNPANNLSFCVADAQLWAEYLESKGFSVVTLFNEQATRNGILYELKELLKDAPEVAVATYSGHGTQEFDLSGDEQDGYDEALFVYDGSLIDDELRKIITNYKKAETSLICIMDSCFSGTVTRMLPSKRKKARARFVPNPNIPKGLPRSRRMFEYEMPEILQSGCAENEYSYEGQTLGHGAFTYYDMKVLKSNDNMTWNELHDKIGSYLPSSDYPQHPQLEGTDAHKNTQVFSQFGNSEPDEPNPPEEPEDPWAWLKTIWNNFFGWLYHWKNINQGR